MNTRVARIGLLIIGLITIGAALSLLNLRFDYEFENFFPSEDQSLDFYYEYKDKFSTDVDFVLVALKNDKGVFEEDFLQSAHAMRDELITVKKVERIISPFDAQDFVLGPFGPIAIPLLHPNESERYRQDSIRIYSNQKHVGSLFSNDAKSISILIEIEPNLSKIQTDTIYNDLKVIFDRYQFDEMHLAGKVIGQAYYIDQIKSEFSFFFLLGVLLIVSVLALVYRSVWGVVVPLLIVLLAVVWLLGFMGLAGKPIDIMTTLLPLVIFVVGISDVIHVLSRYFEEIRNGHPKMKAIKIAYRQVGIATFLTSVTTAIGFLTLVTSNIDPVKELGLYAASGVFMAFILAFSLLPAILVLRPVPRLAFRELSSLFWNKLVQRLFLVSMRNRRAVIFTSVLVAVGSIYGISQVSIDNYLMEDMGKDDPHRHSFEYFENNFAGVRPFEMMIEAVDSSATIFSWESVQEMLRMESYLKKEYEVGFLLSPLTILRTTNQALNGGVDQAYKVPESPDELERTMNIVRRFEKRPEFAVLVAEKGRQGRFSGKLVDVGGQRIAEKNLELDNYFNEMPLNDIRYQQTGMALLIDSNNKTLSLNMMSGLIIAILVVAVIVLIMFRSWRIALISLVPNILPLMVIGGVMGLTGIDLKVSTSIIFGIAFGISVDDSIHYLSKYRMELKKGRKPLWALRRTSLSTGKAIILTSLILCSGFLALATSDFTSTFYVGVLISVTLLVAVLTDLLLLPILLLKKP
ncbi:MAG: MMPL family transporter [Flavobacteriales bacterium]|jgi:hypothetical protein|nr:MMPL family transporter [Flavobacteriales bacterium]MBT3962685.1 MMPL family transporter [Flavobacteriales bacterium]MBT4704183.1 MMPL family transporter [Flavobacteriales bacterium]MBT4929997.1 MMPL family transporter [Flavobacteriales bacterium]MBT5132371.1 MMPL family transporter [Flavobacteriales bacterium]